MFEPDRLPLEKDYIACPRVERIQGLSKVDWDEVVLRPLIQNDVNFIIDYFYQKNSPHPYPYLDPRRMPPEEEQRNRYVGRVVNKGVMHTLTVKYLGKPVGMVTLSPIWRTHADFQLHLWEPEARGRGIGPIVWYQASKIFFRTLGLERIFLRAPKNNPYALGLCHKLPLRRLPDELLTDARLIPELEAEVYEITNAEFKLLI